MVGVCGCAKSGGLLELKGGGQTSTQAGVQDRRPNRQDGGRLPASLYLAALSGTWRPMSRRCLVPPIEVPCACLDCLDFHGRGLCQCHIYVQAGTFQLAALTSMGQDLVNAMFMCKNHLVVPVTKPAPRFANITLVTRATSANFHGRSLKMLPKPCPRHAPAAPTLFLKICRI